MASAAAPERMIRVRSLLIAVAAVVLCACGKSDSAAGITADAGRDATELPSDDAGTIGDASPAPGDAHPCVPADLSNLKAPAWIPVTPLHQSACTKAQITRYLFDCVSATATTASCAPFRAGVTTDDGRCGACIDPGSTTSRGPVFVQDGTERLDVAGCIANAQGNGTAGNECASAFAVVDDCHAKACNAACGTDTPSCVSASNTGACKPYADRTACIAEAGADGGDAGADLAACSPGKTFPASFTALVTLWCGAPSDAGKGGG